MLFFSWYLFFCKAYSMLFVALIFDFNKQGIRSGSFLAKEETPRKEKHTKTNNRLLRLCIPSWYLKYQEEKYQEKSWSISCWFYVVKPKKGHLRSFYLFLRIGYRLIQIKESTKKSIGYKKHSEGLP